MRLAARTALPSTGLPAGCLSSLEWEAPLATAPAKQPGRSEPCVLQALRRRPPHCSAPPPNGQLGLESGRSSRTPQHAAPKLTRLEQVSGFAAKGATHLGQCSQRYVLGGVLKSIQRGLADAELSRHVGLRQPGLPSQAPNRVCQQSRKVHEADSCALGYSHENIPGVDASLRRAIIVAYSKVLEAAPPGFLSERDLPVPKDVVRAVLEEELLASHDEQTRQHFRVGLIFLETFVPHEEAEACKAAEHQIEFAFAFAKNGEFKKASDLLSQGHLSTFLAAWQGVADASHNSLNESRPHSRLTDSVRRVTVPPQARPPFWKVVVFLVAIGIQLVGVVELMQALAQELPRELWGTRWFRLPLFLAILAGLVWVAGRTIGALAADFVSPPADRRAVPSDRTQSQ